MPDTYKTMKQWRRVRRALSPGAVFVRDDQHVVLYISQDFSQDARGRYVATALYDRALPMPLLPEQWAGRYRQSTEPLWKLLEQERTR